MAGNIYAWSTTAASNASADSTINWAEGQLPGTVNDSSRAQMAVHAAFLADTNAATTTGGSANAYTVTSNLTPASLATGLKLRVKASFTNTGACTLNLTPSGGAAFGAKSIKVGAPGGESDPWTGAIQTSGLYEFNYDSAAASGAGAWILLNPWMPDVSRISGFRCGLAAAASTSALTISLKTLAGSDPSAADPVFIHFRSATGTTGTTSPLAVTAATSLTISAGSTMGVTSSTAFRIWVVGFNDAGTFRLGAINCSTNSSTATQIYSLVEGIASSTAEGGAGAADSAGVIYTGSAVSSKAMAVLGYLEWNLSGVTAGTWTTSNLTSIQPYDSGAVRLPGQLIQAVTSILTTQGSLASTTYASSGLTMAITPSSATNIIRFQASGFIQNSAGDAVSVRASRGTTANTNLFGNEGTTGTAAAVTTTFNVFGFDQPNTVGATTYALQMKTAAGGAGNLVGTTGRALQLEAQELMG